MPKHALALTEELTAHTRRPIQDPGPVPGLPYLTDHDYDAVVRDTLARAGRDGLWLFAYGSLLWKPACEVVRTVDAVAYGWHRSFCITLLSHRGTPEVPGLMMALDRGGQCRGQAFHLDAGRLEPSLHALFRRELVLKPPVNVPRWLAVQTERGSVRALGFVVDRRHRLYRGGLSLESVAQTLSQAAGHWGSGAEYLRETVVHLESLGIQDRNLWRLQAMVARRIEAA